MKNFTFWLTGLSMLVIGCGVHVDPLTVKPIQVTHTIVVDPNLLQQFYTSYCKSKYTEQSDIDACVTASLVNFWLAVNSSTPQ